MQKYISAQHSKASLAQSTPAQGLLQRKTIPAIFTILHSIALPYMQVQCNKLRYN